ncbi:flagellar hook-length control protein FliK [Alteromonas oceani]|uniref:Flagellar hook-length control protein FliK n=1 Tax=Alteromonas oceani TaxID=2071609 RepID=A0ABV7JTL9_9ALTE|nr:flagellar hook-length control protein FliK [Alteromonas oceani]
MMQQLATQRSQIAAFPETLPESAAKRDPAQTSESVLPVSPDQSAAAKSGRSVPAKDSFAEVLNRQRGDEQAAEAKSKAAEESKSASENEELAARSSAQQSKKEASDTNSTAKTESGESTGDQASTTDKLAGDSESDAKATSGKMPGGAEEQLETNERQVSAAQTAQERIDNIAAAEEDIADIATLLGGNANPTADGEPDYLALVDAVRALQDKLTPAGDKTATPNEPLSSEDIISMFPTDMGKPIEGDVLTKLQDWLNSLLPGELPGDIQASPLQQMRGAEQVLSDLLALVKQVKAGAASEEAGTENSVSTSDNALLAAVENMTAESADKAAEDAQLSEENLLALAMALLQGLPGERQNAKNDTKPAAEDGEQELLPELAAANVQLAEEPIEVAESTDEALSNQAALLVSLMRQAQQNAETAKTETTVNADKAPVKVTDLDALTSILSESNDKTLQELALVMTDSASKANPALTDTQLSQMRSQLTTGLEEMRAQLKQGHQPAIDLAALVQQTVQDVAPENGQNIVLPVMQDVQQLTQLASMAGMSQGQEQQLGELITVARDVLVHETRQQHGDTLKSMQQQSVFDKPVNVQQTQGQQQIAEKIRWMVNGRQSMAEIRLDPPEMGSMQIRLNVSGDSASVSFVVQSQQAKEALNEAMPRLRDMFSEQGLDLGESFVSQQNSGEAGDGEFADQQGGFGESAEDETKSQETHVVRPANGLIDDYV